MRPDDTIQTMIPATRPRRASMALIALVAAAATVPAACGDSDEQSLCVVYADFVTARAAVQAVDPTAQTAGQAAEIVEEYLDTVQQLRETADGRFRAAVDDLDAAVADGLRTLESVDDEADYATWAPLVEDSLEDAQDAAQRVEELINPQCNPDQD